MTRGLNFTKAGALSGAIRSFGRGVASCLLASLCLLWFAGIPALIAQNDADAAAADAAFARAQAYDEAGNFRRAVPAYRAAVRKFPLAPQAAEAQWRIAEIFNQTGNDSRAFDAFQKLVEDYPDSPNFDRAVATQVEIANRFLEMNPRGILGINLSNPASRASEMYAGILATAPFSVYAPVAQFNMGLAYERQSMPFEAIKSYQAVLDNYPSSAVADDALYQIGFVYMRIGFGDGSQDLSALIQARESFEDFLIEYPTSEKAPQARDNLETIGGRESGDIFRIAQFYEFNRNWRAAVIYYNDVIRRQPQTEEANIAKARIEELRAEFGDEELRTGPERAETGDQLAMRRRLQTQVEATALADYSGPPVRSIVPDEVAGGRTRLRTSAETIRPLPPSVEVELPEE